MIAFGETLANRWGKDWFLTERHGLVAECLVI